MKYCESTHQTKRFKTREVKVGPVGVGGLNPIRIQSMTTSSTRDVEATTLQIMKLADSGCEIARVTVQGIKEADACEEIKNNLLKKGYSIPIVADIHFFPPAAMRVVDFVDKVRINPGNFVDKRASFKLIEYDDASYALELEKIEEKFTPLVEKCKKLKRSMRIGTNHGSLSDRIMNRYGDTPAGMVESAFEYTRICRKNHFHNIIFSMKSSNPVVMIQAYRLLAAEMMKLGWDYPLHLGVTEAGQGEDGRVKSAMGIGSLILDGLGDTIRVSLTEDAWHEIDPCKRLLQVASSYEGKGVEFFNESRRDFMQIEKRTVKYPMGVSMHRDGTVIVKSIAQEVGHPGFYKALGCDTQFGKPKWKVSSADGIVIHSSLDGEKELIVKNLQELGMSFFSPLSLPGSISLLTVQEAAARCKKDRFFVKVSKEPLALIVQDEPPAIWDEILDIKPDVVFLKPSQDKLHFSRSFFEWIKEKKLNFPVILNFAYTCSPEDLVIQASAECGALLCDGLGEGLFLEGPYDISFLRTLSFNILQAARMRTSKTDFISCPSCGRTLFDLQDVTKRITSRTSHLPGVKIAIMGCIVNGPGEMADADFGYVGSKPGMIDLYVGKSCVEKDIPFAMADDRLVELIKTHGRWTEPTAC